MTFPEWVCDRLGRLTGTIILTPHPTAVGNCAEHVYFGLLKARRTHRKLLVLFPYELPWKLKFRRTNSELTAVESSYRTLPYNSVGYIAASCLLTAYFAVTRLLNLVLRTLFKYNLSDRHTLPLIGATTLWQPSEEVAEFSWQVVAQYDWPTQTATPIDVMFRSSMLPHALALRQAMGLPADAWFVCLHVRDGGFHNDAAVSGERNANILNYLAAIREITARGGWVVRMGDPKMAPLPAMAQVIDYPFTPQKSDLMDIYLISVCQAYIGMQSGIHDIALLFQRPMIVTNMASWLYPFPQKTGDIGILKHIFCKSRKRFLSIYEWLHEPWDSLSFVTFGEQYLMFENSPEELRQVVAEFFDGASAYAPTPLQRQFTELRLQKGRELLSRPILQGDEFSDIHQRYRLASRWDSAVGRLSARFLGDNWDQSSRNSMLQ